MCSVCRPCFMTRLMLPARPVSSCHLALRLPWPTGVFELIWLVPKGTRSTQVMLQAGGVGCAQGGFTGCFTPMWLMVGTKKK